MTTLPRRLDFADSCRVALALAMVAAPHALRMPWWVTGLATAFVAWHLHLARMRLASPGRWAMAALVIGIACAIYLHYRTLFGRDSGVALLTVMLTLKLLEMKTRREAAMLLALAFFLVLTNFLFSQTILTAAYMLLCVLLIAAVMTRLQQRAAPPDDRLALRTAALLLAQSVPLMLILFLLFPRVQGPLWGMPADAYAGRSGLSDTMTPGSMNRLILSDNVAFRAAFKSAIPPPNRLYWRGPVLWYFDGRTWSAPPARNEDIPRFTSGGKPLRYTVTLEASDKRWLFALDLPAAVPPAAVATPDFQLLARDPVRNRVRYDMVSYLDYRYGADESVSVLHRDLQLPPGANPRTLALGRELRRRYADGRAIVAAVLRMFREDGYSYTLAPPLLHSNPVDEFLFDTKRGFCEHYASAFAVLMRAAGVPARVVTGYLGGEVNPLGDYLLVRQADAHAWTEVWLRGEGWTRVDPTAAVSPARIERGIAASVSATDELPLIVRVDFTLLRRLHLGWDALAYRWNQWVLGYNAQRQRDLMSRVGMGGVSWRTLAVLLAIFSGAVTAALAFLMLGARRQQARDPIERAYERFCRALAETGLARAPHEGPLDYGARVGAARPDLAGKVNAVVELYAGLRYGASRSPEDAAQLRAAVDAFRAERASTAAG